MYFITVQFIKESLNEMLQPILRQLVAELVEGGGQSGWRTNERLGGLAAIGSRPGERTNERPPPQPILRPCTNGWNVILLCSTFHHNRSYV